MISSDVPFKRINFPAGEMQIELIDPPAQGYQMNVIFTFKKNEDIIELLQFCDASVRCGHRLNCLEIGYVPFSRQDRAERRGQAFSLAVFCELINNLNFNYVMISDPHSDVTPALLKRTVICRQWDFFAPVLREKKDYFLVSPDGGALKKIYHLAKEIGEPQPEVVEFSKHRNTETGEINQVHCAEDFVGMKWVGQDAVIVDDICDGGRTFVEIAKVLKKRNIQKVILMVTHGFFTKGLEVFDDLIDEIWTAKGRVK